jgi:hypothetical protein
LQTPQPLEGQSLTPFLRDPSAASDRAVVRTQGIGNHAVRSQNWRYILYADGSEELYDHLTDPHEFTNVADKVEHESLITELTAWIPRTNARLDPAKHGDERKKGVNASKTVPRCGSVR